MFAFVRGVSFKAMETHVPDLAALDAFAQEFARRLQPGSAVAFHGSLGAGKTTLIRALVRALHGTDAAVSSPTFVFRQRYDGAPPIEHIDLYRIEDRAELDELGLEDAFRPDRMTFVEWPERAPELLPPGSIELRIAGRGAGPRTIVVSEGSGR
jgi:tRNA threonylcarbamoyl adenosine modification protein YjeE